MLIGGLWHGAAWRSVAWGGLHGSYLVCERAARITPERSGNAGARTTLLALLTFATVTVTWVFFRAPTFGDALHLLRVLAVPDWARFVVGYTHLIAVSVTVVGMLAVQWRLRDSTIEQVVACAPWWMRGLGIAVLLLSLALTPVEDRAFICFQF